MSFIKKMFGRAQEDEPPPEVKRVFEKIRLFMGDEATQNELYPEQAGRAIASGAAVDQVPGATGVFGRDVRNPIPVNGYIGEILYVSSLATMGGVQMLGHRIGVTGNIDVFEVVSIDGSTWDILYFDLYHPKKSRLAPSGYKLNPTAFVFATNERVPNFPGGMREAVSLCTRGFLGIPLVAPALKDDASLGQIKRPPTHIHALESVRLDRPRPAS